MNNVPTGYIVIFGLFFVGCKLLADRWDRERIEQYVAERGGSVSDITWQPFGRGWFGNTGDRIYEVRYTDRDRASHNASCKTGLFSGVYFTDDHTTSGVRPLAISSADLEFTTLKRENLRLRAEIERLKNRGV